MAVEALSDISPHAEASKVSIPDVLRRRWRLALAIVVVTFLGAGFASFLQSSTYESVVVLSVNPAETGSNPDFLKLSLPRYVVRAQSPEVLTAVGKSLGIDPAELERGLTAEIPFSSANIRISVVLTDPKLAQEAANAIATALTDPTSPTDRLTSAEILRAANFPSVPVGPLRSLYAAAGLIVGALLAALAIILLERAVPAVGTIDDLERASGVPTIANLLGLSRQSIVRLFLRRNVRLDGSQELRTYVQGLLVSEKRSAGNSSPAGSIPRVVVVTSPGSDPVRHSVVTILAKELSRRHLRVLVIDTDETAPLTLSSNKGSGGLASLRGNNPSMIPATGRTLREVLDNPQLLTQSVQTIATGVDFLPTTKGTDGARALAAGFQRLLGSCGGYDVALVAGPPVFADAGIESLVVEASSTLLVVGRDLPKSHVAASMELLRSARARTIAVVGHGFPDRRW